MKNLKKKIFVSEIISLRSDTKIPKPGFSGTLVHTVFLLELYIVAYNLGSFSERTLHLKVHFELW